MCELLQKAGTSLVYSDFVKQIYERFKVMKKYIKTIYLREFSLRLNASISMVKSIQSKSYFRNWLFGFYSYLIYQPSAKNVNEQN